MGKKSRRERQEAAPTEVRRAPTPAGWWRRDVDPWLAALVALVSFAAWAPSLGNGFVFDDIQVIQDNPRLESVDLKLFLTTPYWTGNEATQAGLYRPLTILSFALDRALFGPGPGPVHATNVVLNALAAALAFALALRLTGSRYAAVAAGALWGVHAVHVEAVANGVGRSEILAALCVFGGLLAHLAWMDLRGAGHTLARAKRWLGLAMVLYFLGLLAKESAVMLPALAFLADWLVVERGRLRAALARVPVYLAYGLPFAAFMALRVSVVGSGTPALQEVMAGATAFQRMLHASETLLAQVGQVLFPALLCGEYADYRTLVRPSLADPLVLGSLVAWALLGWACVRLARAGRHAAVLGVLWFFVAIFPVSNLVIPIGTVRADRLLYTPSYGLVLAVAALGTLLFERSRQLALVALGLAVLAMGARAVSASREWASPEALWPPIAERNPGSPIAWAHLGDQARKAGRREEAEGHFRKAIELRDGAGFFHPAAHSNLAELLAERGDLAGAEAEYRLVLAKEPKRYVPLLNLGELLLRAPTTPERIEEAERLLVTATQVDAADFRCWANLSQARMALGNLEGALAAARQARQAKPDLKDLWAIEGEILAAMGRAEEAEVAWAEFRARGGVMR